MKILVALGIVVATILLFFACTFLVPLENLKTMEASREFYDAYYRVAYVKFAQSLTLSLILPTSICVGAVPLFWPGSW